jgi:chloride channel protein, CIC family
MLFSLHSLILRIKQRLPEHSFFILSSIVVGLTSGLAAVCLKYGVHAIEKLVVYETRAEEFFLLALFPLFGILLAIVFSKFFLKDSLRKGSAEIVYKIIKNSSFLPKREMYGHVVTSALTVGFGGSLGLESPMVSTGSAIGSNFGKTYGLSYKERTILLGCGAAAGIAAAFNSPIAGVLFAIEVLLTEVAATAFIPLIISAACGALISKVILSEGVTLAFKLQQPFDARNIPYYILLGIICGLVSVFYRTTFHTIEIRFSHIANPWIKWLMGGVILFVILLLFPPLFGEGYESVKLLELKNPERLLHGSLIQKWISSEGMMLGFIGCLIIFKIIAASVTLGSGGNGGSFAPSLVIGSYLGYLFSRLINLSGFAQLPVSNFSIVSMAGILSGIFYAPLTAIFLIAEITGGYDLMIPLMVVSSLSLIVARLFHPLSMEAAKLSRMLKSNIESRDELLLSRLNISDLIETNFAVVPQAAKLKDLTQLIASSTRNLFPVVDTDGRLTGIVYLDKVRNIIFDSSKYDTTVKELMIRPPAIVELSENLHEVLLKFETTNQWNLPVVENDRYLGFVSKSTILTLYRKQVIDVT